MRSTFFGLNIARRALQTQQRALDVMGHNIANANTPGYSRQVARQVTTPPFTLPSRMRPMSAGQVGTGVQIAAITRMRDDFIEMQLRNETHSSGQWQARRNALHQVEIILMEPSDYSLRDSMDKFWESLQGLHKDPESSGARAVVREQAISLTQSFQHVHKQLSDLQTDLDRLVAMDVERINSISERLADVNEQIRRVSISGQNPNDLLDTRDQLLLELSELTDVNIVTMDDGTVSVNIDGLSIVNGDRSTALRTETDPATGFVNIYWGNTNREVRPTNGHIAGVLDARDDLIPQYLDDLDTLANELIEKFNEVHREGFTLDDQPGGDFFTGAGGGAANIGIHQDILDDLNAIAASGDGTPGDGSNALRLADVYNDPTIIDGTTSLADFFTSLVSGVGVASQKAKHMVDSQAVLVDHLQGRQDSISGVDLDEEMVDMIRFQQAYNAAARVVTAMDEVIETIISRMGVVGR